MKPQTFNRAEKKAEKPTKMDKVYDAMKKAEKREAARKKEKA